MDNLPLPCAGINRIRFQGTLSSVQLHGTPSVGWQAKGVTRQMQVICI